MRTVLTTEDLKNIVEDAFRSCDEPLILTDEFGSVIENKSINDYLNIKFYCWKNRVFDSDGNTYDFGDWVESLNVSLSKSFALVEMVDSDVSASQDIDSASVSGKITFLVQSDKVPNLDYMLVKIRNAFIGLPKDLQNSNGDKINYFLNIGTLLFDEDPEMIQTGECTVCSANFRVSYLADAYSYSDTKITFSLDGTNYSELPFIKATVQNIFTPSVVVRSNRPDLTGQVATSAGNAWSMSYYDLKTDFCKQLNEIFWTTSAVFKDDLYKSYSSINIVMWIKVESDNHTYIFKDVIDNMRKDITNGDFNVCEISFKGYAGV